MFDLAFLWMLFWLSLRLLACSLLFVLVAIALSFVGASPPVWGRLPELSLLHDLELTGNLVVMEEFVSPGIPFPKSLTAI